MQHNKGITLIALVITIVVLIILAAISIATLTGENGLIQNAQKAAFMEEIQAVKENVVMKQVKILALEQEGKSEELFTEKFNVTDGAAKDTLKREILYMREGMPEDKSPNDYDIDTEFESLVQGDGTINGIYVIDEETGNGKKDTYIYDEETDTVYKIPQTKIGSNIYHSYETVTKEKGGTSTGSGKIDEESEMVNIDNEYYYAPNLKGFSSKDTSVIYYTSDFSKSKEVPAQEYIDGGQQYQIEVEGETYIFHNYGKQAKKWANVKTTANRKEAWWVWIPRYAYNIGEGTKMNIIFIGTDNKPLNPEYNGTLPDGYEPHPAFTQGEKELKGIWISKYEADYSYLEKSEANNVIEPDMTGFDKEHTYIEIYDESVQKFEKEIKLSEAGDLKTVNQDNRWHDYANKKWANIRTDANGKEAWWVWIPRYAYIATPDSPKGTILEVIFVDENDRPIDPKYGNKLPAGYEVHPAFNEGDKKLKGIWMSKYEADYRYLEKSEANNVIEPDMTGFDEENTYIEIYDENMTAFTDEIQLKGADLTKVNENNRWHDYANKKWANIRTDANGKEAWWVWIPRYAYIATPDSPKGTILEVIFVDEEDKPIDSKYGDKLPAGYAVHPAFNKGDKKLKGIWMSKYEARQMESTGN